MEMFKLVLRSRVSFVVALTISIVIILPVLRANFIATLDELAERREDTL